MPSLECDIIKPINATDHNYSNKIIYFSFDSRDKKLTKIWSSLIQKQKVIELANNLIIANNMILFFHLCNTEINLARLF